MDATRSGRTIIGSVVFMDIVAYTKASDRRQLAMKTALNKTISEALDGMKEDDRIILDTGDGCAICFLGDPEDAMYIAGAIRAETMKLDGPSAQVLRIGINLGPLRVMSDLSGRPNVVGDGINVAQRVMSFAGEGEILVSRSYYEVVSCLSDDNKRMFQQLGVLRDKHVREHQVYSLNLAGPGGAEPVEIGGAPAERFAASELQRLRFAGARLAELIGPLAAVITERALTHSIGYDAAIDQMAAAIVDPGDKAAFVQIAKAPLAGARTIGELARTGQDSSATPPRAILGAAFDPAALAAIERHFTDHMGPLAPLLVAKQKAQCATLDELIARLADLIEKPEARARFLTAVARRATAG
jgi:class 3 adenylate cyclase